jgi:hypothetical protein
MGYRVQSRDTDMVAEQVQIELLRQKGVSGRSKLLRSLLRTNLRLSWSSLRARRPELSHLEAFVWFVELNYGKAVAGVVGQYLERLSKGGEWVGAEKLMIADDLVEALEPVVAVLERLGVAYLIGGSVASSVHGITRATADADLVVDLRTEDVTDFVASLESEYYVSRVAIDEALARYSSFNLVHLATSLKLDFFILKPDNFNQSSFSRVCFARLSDTSERIFRLNSPEDVVLQKLLWYRSAGGVSEKQWLDVLGVLKLQGLALERQYLEVWAESLGIKDLLNLALEEAGQER